MPSDYIPKPLHFLLPVAFLIAGALMVAAYWIIGIGLLLIASLAALWIFIAGLWRAKTEFNYSVVEVARQIKEMDPERYRALGIRIPELHIYAAKDGPVQFLEDTEIRMDWFKQFMEDSDEYQFASERLYGEGTIARRQWNITVAWMLEKHYLIENSASGNHTFLWRTGRRALVMQNYLGVHPILRDLNAEETIGG